MSKARLLTNHKISIAKPPRLSSLHEERKMFRTFTKKYREQSIVQKVNALEKTWKSLNRTLSVRPDIKTYLKSRENTPMQSQKTLKSNPSSNPNRASNTTPNRNIVKKNTEKNTEKNIEKNIEKNTKKNIENKRSYLNKQSSHREITKNIRKPVLHSRNRG